MWILCSLIVAPISPKSSSGVRKLLDMSKDKKRWFDDVDIITERHGSNYSHIEKKNSVKIFGDAIYEIVRVQIDQGFHVIPYGLFEESNWKDYHQEIHDSFESITFSPLDAQAFMKSQKEKRK